MKHTVHVKPRSKIESVVLQNDGSLLVRVNALPADGEANARVIEILSQYLKKPKSTIQIISGHKSKTKLIEVI